MSGSTLAIVVLAMMAMVYQLAWWRSRRQAVASGERPHSRPRYHGAWVAFWCAGPALLVLGLWSLIEPLVLQASLTANLPDSQAQLSSMQVEQLLGRIKALASGYGVVGEVAPYEQAAAEQWQRLSAIAAAAKWVLVLLVAGVGSSWALTKVQLTFRARHQVEKLIKLLLWVCSAIAILTTVGIVFSMFGEALRFFAFVSPVDFFFGTVWNPSFSSTGHDHGDYGLLPLLWGTLMVSVIALLVAIPVGLMTAIYMAEYAPARFRSFAKPVIEILAGIPTIVYGVFALMAVGPFFATAGAWLGIEVRATSALTAGVVMGIMIVPFVSSLSDDIISQVPQSLRDGALGLGATHSETIRQVVLPAALPGIVGAFLLATSRAIGETMIVVLAAGNSPQLHGNPFAAVSTVTVSIVNQLTGDTDFAGPQSLVAFALGLTLFVVTLLLNVVALYIVRKYREQYE